MSAASRRADPVVTASFDAYVSRADKVHRGRLAWRNLAFLRTLLREHRDIAVKALADQASVSRVRGKHPGFVVKVHGPDGPNQRTILLTGSAPKPTGQSQSAVLLACKERRGPGVAIVDEIADVHGLKPKVLLGHLRTDAIAAARFHAMYEIKKRLDYSSTQIGALFKRDHTSVLHALKRWPEVRERPDVAAKLDAAQAALGAGEVQ